MRVSGKFRVLFDAIAKPNLTKDLNLNIWMLCDAYCRPWNLREVTPVMPAGARETATNLFMVKLAPGCS